MALVAVALVSIIAMAALSIDIGTFYEAKAEAQRSADAAALTAAQVISLLGRHGRSSEQHVFVADNLRQDDQPRNAGCNEGCSAELSRWRRSPDRQHKREVRWRKHRRGLPPIASSAATNFGVNPVVTVKVLSTNLPIFFGRIFSLFGSNFASTSVSASATAEAYNSSASGTVAPGMIPVKPRCVKPWIVPNIDPTNGLPFVQLADGSITKPGISQLGGGVIGEQFSLAADCTPGQGDCEIGKGMLPLGNPPQSSGSVIHYVPALVPGNAGAVPSCAATPGFQTAIVGCDQNTAYACGAAGGSQADLTENPVNPAGATGDTATAVACLTNSTVGADSLDTSAFPFQIRAGSGNPLVHNGVVFGSDIITTSNSIVTVPIYDGAALPAVNQPTVTIVGFLQVFIDHVDTFGNVNVWVLNVAGCSNLAAGNPTVAGTSPVPVRLITPP